MPTLLETLRPQLGATQSLRSLVQTASGKSPIAGEVPREQDVGELQAAREARLQGQQLAFGEQLELGAVADKSRAVTEEQVREERDIGQRMKEAQSQFDIRANTILSDYENNRRAIATERDVTAMEQLGATMRLANEKYVAGLQQAGEMARLENAANFREQAYREVFANDEVMMRDNVTFKQMMDADDRTFAWAMGNMDIDYAIKVADMAQQQASSKQIFEGVSSMSSNLAKLATTDEAKEWFKDMKETGELEAGEEEAMKTEI